MVQEFADADGSGAHEAFQRWRGENPSGYVVNCRSESECMLHLSPCGHYGDTDLGPEVWGSLTRHRKACSTDRQALLDWARDRPMAISECSSCKPG